MVERRVERNLDGAKNIRKKALASPLQQEVYALPQDPEAQLQDQILTGDAQIQRRHHLINQNLLIASKAIALAGEPPFLSEEQKGPLRDKQKIALDRWRLALPDNTPPAKVLDASDEFVGRQYKEKDGAKREAGRDRWLVGLPENASDKQLAERIKSFAESEKRRYKLPAEATVEDINRAREKYLTEAMNLYFGLDRNAPYEQLCRAMADEVVIDWARTKTKAPKDSRTLLDLPEDATEAKFQEALEAAKLRRKARYHMPDDTSEARIDKIRLARAQVAQRHALGLGLGALERDVVQAKEENDFLDARRRIGCPEDLTESAREAWKIVTE